MKREYNCTVLYISVLARSVNIIIAVIVHQEQFARFYVMIVFRKSYKIYWLRFVRESHIKCNAHAMKRENNLYSFVYYSPSLVPYTTLSLSVHQASRTVAMSLQLLNKEEHPFRVSIWTC